MRIQDIRERRADVVAQMRTLNESAESEQRDLTDEEAEQFNGLKKQLFQVEGQLERAETIAAAERSMQADPVTRGFDGSFEMACQSFSIARAIQSQLDPNVDAGRERELSAECARRAGKNPTGLYVPHEVFIERRDVLASGSGGNLYPQTHRDDLYVDRLSAALRVQQMGATVLTDLTGDQDIPRLTTGATAYWVAEHAAVTESTPAFDTVQLSPKTVGALVEYSRKMIINASPSIEKLLRGDLAKTLAGAIDQEAIQGDGTGNTPTGILNQSGVNSQSLATLTWENILNMIALVDADNALVEGGFLMEALKGNGRGPTGWLTNSHVRKKFMSTARVSGTDSRMIMEDPSELAGYMLTTTSNVPGDPLASPAVDSTLIFGVWSDLLIGYWSQVDIVVNPYADSVFSKGGVLIHALQDCDVAVRHPESFAKATDIAA